MFDNAPHLNFSAYEITASNDEHEGFFTKSEVARLYRGGKPIAELCRIFQTSPGSIYRSLREMGIEPSRLKTGKASLVYHYRDLGMPLQEIKNFTGYSLRHIARLLNGR